jgi:biotin/methionine sulfoxide reductase
MSDRIDSTSGEAGYRMHSSHWGLFTVGLTNSGIDVRPHVSDDNPSNLLRNIPALIAHPARLTRPLVRKGWLENGPGPDPRRGSDNFVAAPWDEVLDMVALELSRIVRHHSPEAIFGGSYGWSSAGRFHHAQSQVHRFLNICTSGYVRSVNDYSTGAGLVLLPHIIAGMEEISRRTTKWSEILDHAQLIVAFGGIPARNTDVGAGGSSKHIAQPSLAEAAQRAIEFVSISPLRDDVEVYPSLEWLPIRPSTDTAFMLGLAYVLETADLCDRSFLSTHCVGYDVFRQYLLGRTDGVPKDPYWAASICQVDAAVIIDLARRMARARTLVSVTFSLQRTQRGEQPLWMAVVLAAMLGGIGLKGQGFAFGLGSSGGAGKSSPIHGQPSLSQGRNPVSTFIPVSRISDLLEFPGESYNYNGQALTYPDIRLVYWAGGNPFHHHQDLRRLARAFGRPDTVIVHDPVFTATARHADIIMPSSISLERNDIGASRKDPFVAAMHKVVGPLSDSRDDYWVFSELATRLGKWAEFTEGRTADEWVRHLYDELSATISSHGGQAPDFDTFWRDGGLTLPTSDEPGDIELFRRDPERHPLKTASGKIEIYSGTIASFGYDDCPGHAVWLEHDEWLGSARAEQFPLQLVANQPATRLHSQLDFGDFSQERKVAGREPARMNPRDAARRGIIHGQVVRVFNDRGSCLAGIILSEDVMPGVIQLSTGAWYEPVDLPGIGVTCIHGNPNILTKDVGTSQLSQACSGQLTLVEVEPFAGQVPPVTVHRSPVADAPDPEQVERLLFRLENASSKPDVATNDRSIAPGSL